jgi:hypothetical protein
MLKLEDAKMGAVGRDNLTGVKGTITGKYERMDGYSSVLVEGLDSTGRPFTEWVQLERLVVDG